MTTLKSIIRGAKTNLDVGKWVRGHIPRNVFPMSRVKDKRYKYGPEYAWRVVKFEAEGHQCRILILLNEDKEILRARLGVEVNGDMVVLSDFEFHASEPGWHCHVALKPISQLGSGAARHNAKKWPKASSRNEFGVDAASALSVVAKYYNFQAQGELI
jgi:hypothetical protein